MKWLVTMAATAAFAVLTGCDPPVASMLSLEQIASDQEVIAEPALVGTWTTGQDGKEFCVIRRDGDKAYGVMYFGGATPAAFSARMFTIGDARFLELVPESDNDFLIPGHAIARVWVNGATLRWAFLDSDWMKEQAGQVLANRSSDKKMVLSGPGASVRALIGKVGSDEKAYGAVTTWERER
jgi:hypothetical protein